MQRDRRERVATELIRNLEQAALRGAGRARSRSRRPRRRVQPAETDPIEEVLSPTQKYHHGSTLQPSEAQLRQGAAAMDESSGGVGEKRLAEQQEINTSDDEDLGPEELDAKFSEAEKQQSGGAGGER